MVYIYNIRVQIRSHVSILNLTTNLLDTLLFFPIRSSLHHSPSPSLPRCLLPSTLLEFPFIPFRLFFFPLPPSSTTADPSRLSSVVGGGELESSATARRTKGSPSLETRHLPASANELPR